MTMKANPQTILVTGGCGYVGSILLRRLLERGDNVVCLDNLMFGGESILDILDHPLFSFHKCDITDQSQVNAILKPGVIDAIVHLAAIVGDPACKRQSDLAYRTNWEASKYLLDQSRASGVKRFVFASTCSNYGKMADPGGYVDEGSPLAPVSLYAELKVRFENYMLKEIPKSEDFSPISLRFATVYGMSHRMRFDLTVNEFTKELAMGNTLEIFGEQFWRPYCHVRDFSRAIMTVLDAPQGKVAYNVFNVGDTAENYTKKMISDELMKSFPQAKINYVQKNEDPRDYRVTFAKIQNELGFEISRTVPEGIREIKNVVELGIIQDPEEQKYYNIPHQVAK